LAVFHEDTDGDTPALVRNVAKANKGKAFFSLSGRVQLLEQWGGSGKFIPSAIMILWKEGEPKFRIWNEENGLAFNEETLNAFVTQTLDGTYQAFLKSEPIPTNVEGTVHTLVGKTFEGVVSGDKPVFVEFYAPWCGHCKKLAPVWDELAGVTKEAVPNLIIAKIDATANSLPDTVSISGFPTLILFKNGQKTIYSGPRDVDSLVAWLKTN